jgi:glycosyltransferase involved in cell wall biosynthesis
MVSPGALRRVVVDLTPLLPGGANGGAKVVARTLVRELANLAPDVEFVLLTSAEGHAECADLEAPNAHRLCVDVDLDLNQPDLDLSLAPPQRLSRLLTATGRSAARATLDHVLPAPARTRVKDYIWSLLKRRVRASAAAAMRGDLLFCPFTAPFYARPDVPVVSIVHDIQFADLPDNFTAQDREFRRQHFEDACRLSDRVICDSEFVRQRVIDSGQVAADRVLTIPLVLVGSRPPAAQCPSIQRPPATLGLRSSHYLLYPANVWPHKNHRRLVDAFAEFQARHPASDLCLLCTGAPTSASDNLTAYADEHLDAGSFAFAGFVPEQEFVSMLRSSHAMIFPSLYEGFGLPVLEAMAAGRPVLCSSSTCLPEVVGDAALLFDPFDSSAIADAIERLDAEPDLVARLVERGRARVIAFGTPSDMAARYLATFRDVINDRPGGVAQQSTPGRTVGT